MPWAKSSSASTIAGRAARARVELAREGAAVHGHEQHQRQDEEEVRDHAEQLRRAGRPTTPPSWPRSNDEVILSICAWSTPTSLSHAVKSSIRWLNSSAYVGSSVANRATETTTAGQPDDQQVDDDDADHRRRPGRHPPVQPPAQRVGDDGQHQREEQRREDVGDAAHPGDDDHGRGQPEEDEHAAGQGGRPASRSSTRRTPPEVARSRAHRGDPGWPRLTRLG